MTFWVTVDEFEKADQAKRKIMAEAILSKIASSESLMRECDVVRRQAAEQTLAQGGNIPENLFESMKLDVEDLLDQTLMPTFLLAQKLERLSGSSNSQPFKPPSIRGKSALNNIRGSARDVAANMEAQNTIAALKVELHECKEQSDAWKASYLNAKEQLVKSERVLQKLLEVRKKKR